MRGLLAAGGGSGARARRRAPPALPRGASEDGTFGLALDDARTAPPSTSSTPAASRGAPARLRGPRPPRGGLGLRQRQRGRGGPRSSGASPRSSTRRGLRRGDRVALPALVGRGPALRGRPLRPGSSARSARWRRPSSRRGALLGAGELRLGEPPALRARGRRRRDPRLPGAPYRGLAAYGARARPLLLRPRRGRSPRSSRDLDALVAKGAPPPRGVGRVGDGQVLHGARRAPSPVLGRRAPEGGLREPRGAARRAPVDRPSPRWRRASPSWADVCRRLLVVVDQFEEVFTHARGWSPPPGTTRRGCGGRTGRAIQWSSADTKARRVRIHAPPPPRLAPPQRASRRGRRPPLRRPQFTPRRRRPPPRPRPTRRSRLRSRRPPTSPPAIRPHRCADNGRVTERSRPPPDARGRIGERWRRGRTSDTGLALARP
jgi:hypothetical protein